MYGCGVALEQGHSSHYEAQQMILDKALNREGHCVMRRNGPSPHNLFLLESAIPESSILFPRRPSQAWIQIQSHAVSQSSQYGKCTSDAIAKWF
jgi:hypothetical protein